MKTDRFNLTWRDFEACSSNSFRGFMARQEFVDVTLVCDDQNQIRAHKVILSACSDFFRNILLKNVDVSQPFIFLDNVSFQDLENVISFMYNGETAISQEDFNSFMRAAQRLRVKGLSEQYCKEVPGDQGDRAERRGPRRARYKSVIKKEEPFEPVKYLNVVDALARSMKTLDTENDEEEGQSAQSDSLFMEYEQYPVARINDIINIENRDEGGEEENENDEEDKDAKEEDVDGDDNEDGDDVEEKDDEDEQKEPIAEIINNDQVYEDEIDGEEDEEEDLENQAEEEFENQNNEGGDNSQDTKGFFPNENGHYDDSESESDDEGTMDGIEESLEIEDVYEYINENDGEIFTTGNEEDTDNKDEVVKLEVTLTEEEPLSNYVSRLRKRKRSLRKNYIKREAFIAEDENVEQ